MTKNEMQAIIDANYKRMEEIEIELELEYKENGHTVHASQLECAYELLESTICELEEKL